MKRFHEIEGAEVIVKSRNGVYKQVNVARRGDELYAVTAGGFVRLYAQPQHGTSVPTISWHDLDLPEGNLTKAGPTGALLIE